MGILGSSWKDEDSSQDEPVIKHFKSETKDVYDKNIMSHLIDDDDEDSNNNFECVIKHFKD